MAPAGNHNRMDRFFAAHRESGLAVTTQRQAVFEAILGRSDHPTAEQLYRKVQRKVPQISRMTVHRILGTLVSLGLVAKTCHPGSAARFDPKLSQHHHLVCLDCGRIMDVEDPRLNELPWPHVANEQFQIEDYHVHFRGYCARCRRAKEALNKRRSPASRTAAKSSHRRASEGD